MIWDQVARVAESSQTQVPELRRIMQSARLFVIDDVPQNFLPKSYTREQCEFHTQHFFLPFRTMAIEDKCSLVFLRDVHKDARGLDSPRAWIEFLPLGKLKGFREEDVIPISAENEAILNRLIAVTIGVIDKVTVFPGDSSEEEKNTYIEGKVTSVWELNLDTKQFRDMRFDPLIAKHVGEGGLRNALQAIHEVIYFNDPTNFILEETPPSYQRRLKSKTGQQRVQRSGDRPKYTVLKPTQIRRRMRLPEPTMEGGLKRRPHERRTHLRSYPNDDKRWPQAHGKTVVVKGSWIGPKESVVDGKRYRVLVDARPQKEQAHGAMAV